MKITPLFLSALVAVMMGACQPNETPEPENGNPENPEIPDVPQSGVEINGVRWASRNVAAPAAFAAGPTEAGMFFQWGSATGWSAEDPLVSSDGGTTWNTDPAAGGEWMAANDPCPEGWRMPTAQDFKKLCNEVSVTSEWVAESAETPAGRTFTDLATGNSIFLPAAGYRHYTAGERYYAGRFGYYWTDEAAEPTEESDYNGVGCVEFNRGYVAASRGDRNMGYSVRCVAKSDNNQ